MYLSMIIISQFLAFVKSFFVFYTFLLLYDALFSLLINLIVKRFAFVENVKFVRLLALNP